MGLPPTRATLGLIDPGDGLGGNRITALRWARLLRRADWHVFREARWSGRSAAALIVIHAERGAASIRAWRAARGEAPLIVCAAGTDLYGDGNLTPVSQASFAAADAIVLLQELGRGALPVALRARARVIHQSAPRIEAVARGDERLEGLVLAHLRPVKDPLLAARAVELLPSDSRWCVRLAGALRDEALRAELEAHRAGPRFIWDGALTRRAALGRLAHTDIVLSTSRHEGGANVISEALAAGKPILATDIPGSSGLLGTDHPGLFPVGDARALAALLRRFEGDPDFRAVLQRATDQRAWIADPELEQQAWRALLDELLPRTGDTSS